jgi:hypothetical protein
MVAPNSRLDQAEAVAYRFAGLDRPEQMAGVRPAWTDTRCLGPHRPTPKLTLNGFAHQPAQFLFSHKQPSAISRQPSAISHQPSAISHQPSAVSHQPSAFSHQPSALA